MSFRSVVTRGHYRFIALYCVLLSCYGAESTRTPDIALTAHALDPAPGSVETLFGSALAEYWDARSGVTSSNGRVATWAGLKSGTLLNAPINSVNQPVLGADGANFAGVPVVQTSASNGAFLSGQLSPTLLGSGARPYIAVVHRSHALSQAAARVIDVTSANQATRISMYGEDASARSFFCPDWPNGGCQYRLGTGDQSVLPVISELWADTDGLHFAQDGKEESPSSGNAATQPLVRALERVVLGGLPDGSQLSDTSFAQVVITASVPSTQQRAAYREYARDAWGLNRCGDGFLGASEACDDGNSNDSDSCSNLCTLTAPLTSTPGQFLGSGVVEWWDARVGVGSLAGGVTAWRGQANGTLLQTETQDPVGRPAYSAEPGFFRQRPVIQSSTQNNAYLRGALASNLLPLGSRPYIAIIHRSRTLSTSPSAAIDARSADTTTRMVLFSEDSSARGLYCPAWPDLACQHYLDTDNDGTASVLTELWVDADGAHYAENGRESSTTSAATTQALVQAIEHISVGALGSNDQVSNSTFAQIVLASSPPSAAQRAQYLQYACDEWGIAACGSPTEDTTPTAVKAVFGSALAEYWDARTGVFTNNQKVVSWTGLKNGSVLNAPSNPANQPSFGSDGSDFGGAPVVQSSIASGAYMSGQLSAGILAAGSRPYIAVVSRSRNLAQGPSRVVDATSDNQVTRLNLGMEQASTRAMYCPDWPNGGCQYQNGTNDQLTRPVVSELWVDTDGLHVAYDGREETLLSGNVASQALVRAIERVVLGALPDGSQLSDSSFAQVVVTSSLPTAAQRAEYRTYAMSAWAMHRCGDGFLGANEQCDDGNTNDADSCSNACAANVPLTTTPDQVLGSGVAEWWDARTGLGTLGGGVTTWRGQRNGTLLNPGMSDPASRPAYVADPGYFHERPIVQSSIQNNAFLTGVLSSALLPLNSRPYIALIRRSRALSTATERIADIASSNGATTRLSLHTEQGAARGFYCPDWPTLACQYYNNSDNQTTSAVLTELWVDTDGTHYAENGREVAASTPAANQALLRSIEQISLGALGANNQVSNDDFAQIVLASAPPTQAQRSEYLRYACAEWGLAGCSLDGFSPGTICNPALPRCGFGRECRNGVGVYFGRNASDYVCWDTGCDDRRSGFFECGSVRSRCGTCPACTSSCEGKNCGSNGCWGSCGTECTQGQRGCVSSADCAAGLVCMPSGSGSNECVPETCGHPGLNPCSDPANAGLQTICGECRACEPECAGRDCGPAANGCGECSTSSLGEDEFCSPSGHIQPQALYANRISPSSLPPADGATTVGTMPGTFAVSDFGQATYTMPLQVPPGRNGIQPELTLVYNSGAGNGYLGAGWGLSGLSAINRCPKTIAQDGAAAPITYTESDRFCLDGNRLVLENAGQEYGANATTYRTELETFSRIKLVREPGSSEPDSFEVRAANGQILTYDLRVGGTGPHDTTTPWRDAPSESAAIRTQTWLLTAVRDRFGNTMRIRYTAPAAQMSGSTFSDSTLTAPSEALEQLANGLVREYHPSRIEYTSNGSTEADRTIDFGYRVRADVLTGYNAGVRFDRSQLLQRIVATVQGEAVFTYTLRYDEPREGEVSTQARDRLTSIQKCARSTSSGATSLTCMPPTRFEYSSVSAGFAASTPNPLPTRDGVLFDADRGFMGNPLVLDLNGDGRDDVLVPYCTNGSGLCTNPHWGLLIDGEFRDTTFERRVAHSGNTHLPSNAYVVDYDLDGKDDVVEIFAQHPNDFTVLSMKGGELSRETHTTLASDTLAVPHVTSNAYLLDANGDGGTDLLLCTPQQSFITDLNSGSFGPTGSLYVYFVWQRQMHDLAQGFSNTIEPVTENGPPCDSAAVVDIDGDGRQELMFNVGPVTNIQSVDTFSVATEVAPAASAIFWPMTGGVARTGIPATSSETYRATLDINGDGLADIAEFDSALKVTTWVNTGAGFVSERQTISLAQHCGSAPFGGKDFLRNLRLNAVALDANGNGRTDLVVKCGNSAWAVLRSHGDTFSVEPLGTDVAPKSNVGLFAYDANNDGLDDLAQIGMPGEGSRTFPRVGSPKPRLTAITNGLGAKTTISYTLLGAPPAQGDPLAIYVQNDVPNECRHPLYCRPFASEVVRKHQVWDPNSPNPIDSLWYGYEDSVRDHNGRGSLGFVKRRVVDEIRNTKGNQSLTVVYDNKLRDADTGLYPFAGRAKSTVDRVVLSASRARDAGFILKDPVIRHPTSRSVFAFYATETDSVIEYDGETPSWLKNVSYLREFDQCETEPCKQYGNLTKYTTQWADSHDQKVSDMSTVTTDYVRNQAHDDEWLIRSPRSTVVEMVGERTSRRAQTFVYAEDGDGSHQYEFTGEPEAVIDQPGDPQQLTHRVVYDSYGNITTATVTGATIDGERSRLTSVEYDDFHMFPVRKTLPGREVFVSYDQGLGVAVATEEEGRANETVVNATILDGFGRKRRVIAPGRSPVDFSYSAREESMECSQDPGGALHGGFRVTTTRQGGPTDAMEFDVLGREAFRATEGFKNRLVSFTTYGAGGLGKPTSTDRLHTKQGGACNAQQAAARDSTTIDYDILGRITALHFPDQTEAQRCYVKNVECSRDALGITACTVFDEHGRAAHRVEPVPTAGVSDCATIANQVAQAFPSEFNAASTGAFVAKRFHYHPDGALLSIVDAAGHETRFERDDRGNVIEAANPDSGSWQRQYNAFSELEIERSPAGVDAELRYDERGRLRSRTDIGTGYLGANELTSFIFDFDEIDGDGFRGKPVRAISPNGVVTSLKYDQFGRLTQLRKTIPGVNGSQPLTRHTTYDANGRPDRVHYDSNGSGADLSYRYKYTAFGHLRGVARPDAADPGNPSLDTDYWTAGDADPYGQVNAELFANGVQTSRAFEPHTGRLLNLTSALGATEVQHIDHTYFQDGMLRSLTKGPTGSWTVTSYDYDALKRLTNVTRRAGTPEGPILGSETYVYDADGNIDRRDWSNGTGLLRSWTFSYDPAQPHAVKTVNDGSSTSTLLYRTDGTLHERSGSLQSPLNIENDARVKPHIVTATSGQVWLDYDAHGTRVLKTSPGSEVVYLDEHYSRRRVPNTSGFEEHLLISEGGRTVAELVRSPAGSESIYYLHTDRLGSVDVVTDQAGVVVERRDYEEFGTRRTVTGGPGSPLPLRPDFTGHELDVELGLINMKARLYDPQLGRFLAPDPIIASPLRTQGSNPYAYVGNNPTNLIDPTGMCEEDQMTGQEQQCDEGSTFVGSALLLLIQSIFDGSFDEKWESFKDLFRGNPSAPANPTMQRAKEPTPEFLPGSTYNARSDVSALGLTGTDPGQLIDVSRLTEETPLSRSLKLFSAVTISFTPGVGELADVEVLTNPASTTRDRVLATGSLAASVLTVMGAPNYGGANKIFAETPPKLLTAGSRLPNAAGKIVSFVTSEDQIFYRVFSGDNSVGAFLTSVRPKSADFARQALDLPPGNTAEFVQEVLVPAGTRLQRSRVRPGTFGGRGGAEQFELLEYIPTYNFGPGVPLQ